MSTDRLQIFLTLLVYSLPGLVAGFTLHELAHGLVADRLGDDLPRRQGRLSLDPRRQIDPVGFALLIGVGFGFARPVQINTLRIRTDRARALVSFAGPLTNLVIAIVLGAALRILVQADPTIDLPSGGFLTAEGSANYYLGQGGGGYVLFSILYEAVFVNALLFVFNMIPIPPLDGFQVLKYAVGRFIPDVIRWMEQNWQILAVVGLIVLFVLPRAGSGTGGNILTRGVNTIVERVYGGPGPLLGGLDNLLNALSNQ